MNQKIYFLIALILPVFASASEVSIENSDFVMRSVNFVIFVALLWWLVAKWIKGALKSRADNIATQLNAVQDKLAQSRAKKEVALKELEKSKILAKDIVEGAKKEANILSEGIALQCKNDSEMLRKSHAERLNFEQKRIKKAVIAEVLDELLSDKNIALDKKAFVEILTKRVA